MELLLLLSLLFSSRSFIIITKAIIFTKHVVSECHFVPYLSGRLFLDARIVSSFESLDANP